MLRSSVVVTAVLACAIGPLRLPADAREKPVVLQPALEREAAAGALSNIPAAANGFVTIAVRRADCGCRPSLTVTKTAARELTVRLVDSVGLPAETREAVAEEILRFSPGRRIDDNRSVQADSTGHADTIYVLLRPGGAPRDARSPRKRTGQPDDAALAWTLFQQDQAGSLIFVWIGSVQRLLDGSKIEGRPFTHWHMGLRRALLARAVGRITAHEIGHLMCGPSHAPGGVMKRRFSSDDLLWNTTPLSANDNDRACGEAPRRRAAE